MGKRLHVATTYEVSFNDGNGDFNWKIEAVQDLLEALGCKIQHHGNEDDYGYPDEFEILKSEFLSAIEKLKAIDLSKEPADWDEEDVRNLLKKFQSLDYVVKSFERYAELAEKRGNYFHFCWF